MTLARSFRYIIMAITSFIACCLSTNSFAKTLNLHAEPKQESKIIETVNADTGVITIFQPKNSDWIKVANPQNGNVGWVKTKELTNTQFNLQVIQSNDGPRHYQVIQYGNVPPEKNQSISTMIEQMEKRQQIIQKEMQQNMQMMFKEMQSHWANFPMIVPVEPTQSEPTKTAATPPPPKQQNKAATPNKE